MNCRKAAREDALRCDLGAPFLTIATCVTVGVNIVRPQHDQSLCKERPHIRLTITREHTVLPYEVDVTYEFTYGAPRSAHPAVYIQCNTKPAESP